MRTEPTAPSAETLLEPETPPQAARPPRPRLGAARAIGLLAINLGLGIAVVLPLTITELAAGLESGTIPSFLISQLIAWPITMWIALRWARVSAAEAFALKSFPLRILPALVLVSFGLPILLNEVSGLVPVPDFLVGVLEDLEKSMSNWAGFLSVVVVAPIVEELFFRGQLLVAFRKRYTVTRAVWATALLFALMHLNPWQAISALPLGLLFAWLVLRTGSTMPGLVCHVVVNFLGAVAIMPLGRLFGMQEQNVATVSHLPAPLLAIGAAAALIGGYLLRRQLGARTTVMEAEG